MPEVPHSPEQDPNVDQKRVDKILARMQEDPYYADDLITKHKPKTTDHEASPNLASEDADSHSVDEPEGKGANPATVYEYEPLIYDTGEERLHRRVGSIKHATANTRQLMGSSGQWVVEQWRTNPRRTAIVATLGVAVLAASSIAVNGESDSTHLSDGVFTSECDGSVFGTASLQAKTSVLNPINVVDSEKQRQQAANEPGYDPETSVYYVANKGTKVPGGNVLTPQDIEQKLPKKEFSSLEKGEKNKQVYRLPMAKLDGKVDLVLCQEDEPGVSVEDGAVKVDLNAYTINAVGPNLGQTKESVNSFIGYEQFNYQLEGDAAGYLPKESIDTYNAAISPADNPDTAVDESGLNRQFMQQFQASAREAFNRGECKTEVIDIAKQAIKTELYDQAREQGVSEDFDIEFVAGHGPTMPAQAYGDGKLNKETSVGEVAIDQQYLKKHSNCSNVELSKTDKNIGEVFAVDKQDKVNKAD